MFVDPKFPTNEIRRKQQPFFRTDCVLEFDNFMT